MTAEKFNQIKDKIEDLKESRAKAKGVMEGIEKRWEKDYGISTMEEAVEKEKEFAAELEKLETKKKTIMNKIEKVADWDNIL